MTATVARLRLPVLVDACLFDLDGVLTDTAALHAEAWKETFDRLLRARPEPYVPFDLQRDYAHTVDGKERNDGVRAFLASRNIVLPDDEVIAIGNRKNARVLQLIHERGVSHFDDAIQFVETARAAGVATAVVSSSTNCRDVLEAAGIAALFDVRVDACLAAERGLRGKPAPDMFVAAAELLGVPPARAAVFEDALVGVAAGHAGGFALVVGIARSLSPALLREHGADVVVADLTELLGR